MATFQLLLIYATKDNFEEDMKECQDMLNVWMDESPTVFTECFIISAESISGFHKQWWLVQGDDPEGLGPGLGRLRLGEFPVAGGPLL